MKSLRSLTPFLICAGLLLFATSCLPSGQKLLRMEVLQGSEIIVATEFGVDDRSTVAEIWDAASGLPVHAEVLDPALTPSQGSPLELKLTGPVEVRITHVRSLQTRATMTDLTLIRSSPTTSDWRLPKEEVDRAQKAAGL